MADRLGALLEHEKALKALQEAEVPLLLAYGWERVALTHWKIPSAFTCGDKYKAGNFIDQQIAMALLNRYLLAQGVVLGGYNYGLLP